MINSHCHGRWLCCQSAAIQSGGNSLFVREQGNLPSRTGKPPKDTRFKPGKSGNPKGWPRGSNNKRPGMHEERMKDIVLDEVYRDITIREGHRSVTVPMAQACGSRDRNHG
ncbi:DUF5681 domain-containing protein [Ruegeria profundi]|uniref:DUF5681 domain-containing protein n=1 Tax=Ruegeria profundi TaxID=1685378 RepID=UPI003B8A8A7A